MNKANFLVSFLLLVLVIECHAQSKVIKRRADSYFGLHFDFHATSNDRRIGLSLNEADVTNYLKQVKPDYIQVDTKGHPGISSYPTKIGVPAPNFVNDPLKIFRAVTKSLGIGLYAHFSGVVDWRAVKDRPEWARLNHNGQLDKAETSIFSSYCDNYFIPQIKELSSNYNIDGVWVDGEVWAVQADFTENAKKAFVAATGKKPVLSNDYMAFTRKSFHKYLNHYTSVLHQFNPKLQIASNWAFSTFMPGPVDAGVDFLSGDIVDDDVKNMTIEPRVFSGHGKPWDLMIWGFMGDKNKQGHFWKSALQLQQKAAIIISQGGGYQVYLTQNRDASLPKETAPILKEVSDFCYARKPYSFRATAIPQIAVLLSASGHDFDLGTSTAFDGANGGNNNIKGTLTALLNSQYSVQILQDYQLRKYLFKYPMLVITEWNYMDPKIVSEVEAYVNDGGKLLIIGGVSLNMFSKILPKSTTVDNKNPAGLPIKKAQYGKGTVIGIDANVSLQNFFNPSENYRLTIAGITRQLFPKPMVTVTGSNKVHVVLNSLNNKTLIHLINTGEQWGVKNGTQLDFQLPVLPKLTIALQTKRKPASVLLQPGNQRLAFSYHNGQAFFSTTGIAVHSIVQVSY